MNRGVDPGSSNTRTRIQKCTDPLVEQCIYDMRFGAVPKSKHLNGKRDGDGQEVQPVEIDAPYRFVPKPALRRIFTVETIEKILGHNCEKCKRHLPQDKLAALSLNHAPKRILETDAALCLFGLLVKLQIPRLIGAFLGKFENTDMPMPSAVNQQDLKSQYFASFQDDNLIDVFAQDFKLSAYQFSVPSFEDKKSTLSYDAKTIMPYLDEELIDEGGFGRVFKVTIHPEYCPMYYPNARKKEYPPKILARKEFPRGSESAFREQSNLDKFELLEHDHLIRIQKTYQLGDNFNILLPFAAKGNLHKYLRSRTSGAPYHRNVSKNSIWVQMIGISRGLEAIINFKHPERPGHAYSGNHLDLKPQNILVDSDSSTSDLWKIADMGQAEIVDRAFGSSGSSRLGYGGTDAYAPPEYRFRGHNSRYDIWSLGIILLEVLTFAIKGPEGLDGTLGLDTARYTRDGIWNCRFYTGSGDTAAVKPEILRWIDDVLMGDQRLQGDERLFANKVIALMKRMLRPQATATPSGLRRIGIETVVTEMQSIFGVQTSGSMEETVQELKKENETTLVDIQQVDFFRDMRQGPSEKCYFIVFEDYQQNIRAFAGNHYRNVISHREHIRLILDFQHWREEDDEHNGSFRISFTAMESRFRIGLGDTCFSINDETSARRVQQSLLRQRVSYRYKLKSLEAKPYTTVLSKIWVKRQPKITSTPQEEIDSSKPEEMVIPTWVEIWIEKPKRETNRLAILTTNRRESNVSGSSPGAPHSRQNRTINPVKAIPMGRVVIYCKDRILIIPFQKECSIDGTHHEAGIPTAVVTFQPQDKRQRMYFNVSTITEKGGDPHPGIPMDRFKLQEAEQNSFEAKRVVLKFDSHEKAKEFYNLYLNEKLRWLDMVEAKPVECPSLMPED